MMKTIVPALALTALVALMPGRTAAQETLPWNKGSGQVAASQTSPDTYGYDGQSSGSQDYQPEPNPQGGYQTFNPKKTPYAKPGADDAYQGGGSGGDAYQGGGSYSSEPQYGQPPYQAPPAYAPPPPAYGQQPYYGEQSSGGFTVDEIKGAGHRFFGNVSSELASVIEYAFQNQGRPNGYILGEEGGGAFVAGLRYGEGVLNTRDAGSYKVYWQGPSVGYDFGAEGSKTMILVYNLRSPADIYRTFSGIGGQAYLVGGVGITYLSDGNVTLAPIRSGIGLRLGANVGYLKYTPQPTWNPF